MTNRAELEKMARLHWSWLNALLVAAILVEPLLGSTPATELSSLLMFAIAVVGAVFNGTRSSHVRRAGGLLALVWFAAMLAATLGVNLGGLVAALTLLFVFGALAGTFGFLLNSGQGDLETLMGAVFGYLLLATAFAILFVQIENHHPGAFTMAETAELRTTLLYYSLVTITTLGYGDVLPANPFAQMAAGFEAVIGVLYIAVMIGSIVNRAASRR